jgi:DNA helicase-2/ATP-dependent DNA helicase PcrA
MESFEQAYKALNSQQKKAVDVIEGPLLVVAGPGTGKTQLLALRAANILSKDSTMLAGNILCLTFTNNAANNMRERLVSFIGQDAYRVAIHTFNSFGSYVMNAYPEHFYEYRETQTADELTTHNIIEKLLEKLPGYHPLAARAPDGSFFAQPQIRNLIGDAKRADLSPKDLRVVLKENEVIYKTLTPLFRQHWPERMAGKDSIKGIAKLLKELAKLKPAKSKLPAIVPVQNLIIDSLKLAAEESAALPKGKTKPFTTWKNEWLEKDENNEYIFTGQKHLERLMPATDIYEKYQKELTNQSLADFNDQIMWVIRALELHPELRYNLQERFQYIMVDEFQDTNRSQLLLTSYLTDAPVHEGRPNIMVVGDDDQAIFRFQGADIGNVSLFESMYREPAEVALQVNYRSNEQILSSSKQVSRQIEFSLEKTHDISKELESTVDKVGLGLELNEFEHESQQYSFAAHEIRKLLDKKTPGKEIAVLARERPQLDALLPYLREQKIPINYERRENVLEQPHILNLIAMARLLYTLQQNQLEFANELFAQVLSQPMWGIKPSELWQISAQAYRGNETWFDVINSQEEGKCKQISDFFIRLGLASATMPLEQVLDKLIGIEEIDEDDEFISPYKNYYFGTEILEKKPDEYLSFLSQLTTIRRHLRNYQADENRTLQLNDFIEFVDSYARSGLTMLDQAPHNENEEAVQLMTVHKAKGLEFENVFVIGLQDNVWTRAGSRGRFSYPTNLKTIRPSDNQDDDGIRLLFVAMTRARQSLYMSYFKRDEDGSPSQPYSPLLQLKTKVKTPQVKDSTAALVNQYEQRWLSQHVNGKNANLKAYFEDQLANYRLSVTHLNNFLDVSAGGPNYFFTQNLMHFPSGKNPMATYGTVVHSALSRAHRHVLGGKELNSSEIIKKFIEEIESQPLSKVDKEYYSDRGEKALEVFFAKMGATFNKDQAVDVDFKNQAAVVNEARLRGIVDRMDLDRESKTVTVADYKTGAGFYRWQSPPSATDHQKIKAHRYRNQLLFYKIMIDNAADWGRRGWKTEKGVVWFVEPERGKIRSIELEFEQEEIEKFAKLIGVVWQRIQAMEFPDISKYPPNLAGMLAFEQDLLSN